MKDLTTTFSAAFKTKEEYAVLKATESIKYWSKLPEVHRNLVSLYKPQRSLSPEDKLNSKLMATWLNAVLTQKRYVFMSNYRDFSKLLANDKNVRRNSVNGDEFKSFNHHLLINKYIRVVREPTNAKSGVYEVIHSAIETLLEQVTVFELKKAQMAQCIEIYEENRESSLKSSLKSSHEHGFAHEHGGTTTKGNVQTGNFSKEEKAKEAITDKEFMDILNAKDQKTEASLPLAKESEVILDQDEYDHLVSNKSVDQKDIGFLADMVGRPMNDLTPARKSRLTRIRNRVKNSCRADTFRPVDLEEVKALEELEKKRDLRIKTFLAYTPEVQLREATAFLGTGYVKQMSSHQAMVEVYIAEVRLWDGRYGC